MKFPNQSTGGISPNWSRFSFYRTDRFYWKTHFQVCCSFICLDITWHRALKCKKKKKNAYFGSILFKFLYFFSHWCAPRWWYHFNFDAHCFWRHFEHCVLRLLSPTYMGGGGRGGAFHLCLLRFGVHIHQSFFPELVAATFTNFLICTFHVILGPILALELIYMLKFTIFIELQLIRIAYWNFSI